MASKFTKFDTRLCVCFNKVFNTCTVPVTTNYSQDKTTNFLAKDEVNNRFNSGDERKIAIETCKLNIYRVNGRQSFKTVGLPRGGSCFYTEKALSSRQTRWVSTDSSDNSSFESAISEENIKKTLHILQPLDLNKLSRRKDKSSEASSQEKVLKINSTHVSDRPAKEPDSDTCSVPKSAVLMPLCRDKDRSPCILVTLRPNTMASHRWEVCFPGGKQNQKDDGDVVKTAIRETIEELGISRSCLKIYGATKPFVRERPSKNLVYPVIGYIEIDHNNHDFLKSYNPLEVESVYLIRLENLCKKSNWRYTRWRNGYVTPVYLDSVFDGRSVPRIWGMTAGFLFMFAKVLLPSDFEGVLPFVD